MYSIGSAPAPLQNVRLDSLKPNAAPQFSQQSPDPVNGTSASTSPSGSTLGSFPGASVQAAPFTATPSFVLNHGANGDYYTNGGQAQAPNYAPLEPYVTLPATRTGLTAHGVIIDSLTSQDDPPGFNPDNLRPTVDLSADEPEPQFNDEASPSKIPTLVSLDTPDGLEQSLNLATGQFFTQSTGDPQTNVQRRWTQIGGRVTYSTNSGDFTPPTIDSMDAFTDTAHTTVSFTGNFSDLDDAGNPGQVVFAQVVYDLEDGTGHWSSVQLAGGSDDPRLDGRRAVHRRTRAVLRRGLRRGRQLRLQLEQGPLLRRAGAPAAEHAGRDDHAPADGHPERVVLHRPGARRRAEQRQRRHGHRERRRRRRRRIRTTSRSRVTVRTRLSRTAPTARRRPPSS